MQLAIARADVALDPMVFQDMPIAPGSALDGLIHVAVVLGFRDLGINGDQLTTGQDAKDSQSMTTRPSAVAGLFYADDPDELRMQVLGLLADVAASTKVMPKALIAPHAGYAYSGRVAAAAFATLLDSAQMIKRVVLIGPAHYFPVRGIAAPTVDAFETPLGRVAVDLETLSTVADLKFIIRADAPHAPEHALEVELPFLQTLLTSFEVVPLIVGEATPHDVAHVLRRSWGGPETLIVVSSDLSHYHDYEAARRLDAATAAAIEHGDWSSLGPNQACGRLPLAGLLLEAERRGLKARRLSLCNSGDTAGSRDRVVGYGAWMFA
jgi:MEMO1 family protein